MAQPSQLPSPLLAKHQAIQLGKLANMGASGSFDSSVMVDDPTTPLYNPEGISFNQGFLQQPPISDNKANSECFIEDALELPINLQEMLNNWPNDFNFGELANVGLPDDFHLLDDCSNSPTVAPATSQTAVNETTPSTVEALSQQDEQTVMEFEDQAWLGLHPLDIQLASSNIQSEPVVSTPDVVEMLLEHETFQTPHIPVVVQEIKTEIDEVKPEKKTRKSTTKSDTNDLRRVRNNIASRKSRENRKTKQKCQKQLAEQLESENKALEQRCRDYETLIDRLKSYMEPKHGAFVYVPSVANAE